MLDRLNDQIRHCHERAIECGRKAREAQTEEARKEFLALQQNWLALAASYEVSARIAGFVRDAKRNISRWRGLDAGSRNARGPSQTIVPFLIGKPFAPEMVAELSKAFDRACSELMVRPSDSKAEVIARKIIELAQRGLSDSTDLLCTAIQELGLRG